MGRRVPLPRPSAWLRLALTPLAVGEPSPALLARTRRSTRQPALPRLPSVPPWTGRSPSRERRTKTRTKTTGNRDEDEGQDDERFSNSRTTDSGRKTQATKTTRADERRGRGRAPPVSVLYGAGLRPSLRPVSGSTPLLGASQKGAFLTPVRVTPRIHQSGTSCPTPPLSHSSEKTGRQKSARLLELL